MSADSSTGARLRAARLAARLTVADLAEGLRDAASDRVRAQLPKLRDLERTIRAHEAGEQRPGPRYRLLYAAALDRTEDDLFALHPPVGDDPEQRDRLGYAAARPTLLDAGAVVAARAVLAGQRRLEDAMGPGALLGPVAGQLDTITAMLRDAGGPHRDDFGRVVAEWTTYAGWLHAALRRDAEALALFARAEDLADELDCGTIAAIATSFRGYVARQQGRPRGVIRASAAALATPGAHSTQRTFDHLQAAQGYAALGDSGRARELLDTAADMAASASEPPPAVYWYSEPFFLLNIGAGELAIGRPADAAALLRAGLDGMPADQAGAEWLEEYRDAYDAARERA